MFCPHTAIHKSGVENLCTTLSMTVFFRVKNTDLVQNQHRVPHVRAPKRRAASRMLTTCGRLEQYKLSTVFPMFVYQNNESQTHSQYLDNLRCFDSCDALCLLSRLEELKRVLGLRNPMMLQSSFSLFVRRSTFSKQQSSYDMASLFSASRSS